MHVLISGAGIAGSVLAWHLSKIGAHVTVVEKSYTAIKQGQNIDIHGSALTVIKRMGLLEKLREFNTTEKGTQLIDAKGRPFAPFPVKGGIGSPTSEYEILRGDLAFVLYEAAKDCPNVEFIFNTTVEEVLSNDDDGVRVKLSDGSEKQFDLLVAADGQWSKIRKENFCSHVLKVIDTGLYGSYWTVPRLPTDSGWWDIYHTVGSRSISTRPDPHGTTRAFFGHMPCNNAGKQAWQEAIRADKKIQKELLKREFSDAGWQAQRLLAGLDEADDFYFQACQQIKMSTWSKGRIICLGDTAYAPTPLTGMGTSLAVTGAHLLAGELSNLKNGEHPARAFDTYESIYRPFVEKSQFIPYGVPGIAHPSTAWGVWILRSVAATMSKVLSYSWVVRWFGSDENDEEKPDFPLPHYSCFDGQPPR